MMDCPKCKSTRISGPSYVKREYGEALNYVCNRCGYSKDEPTADADTRSHPWAQTVAIDANRQK